MADLTLDQAQTIVTAALREARAKKLNPMSVVVVDARGVLRAAAAEDGCSKGRWRIALGKASGAIELGIGSRRISAMAIERPHFMTALNGSFADGLVPVAGGLLIRDGSKAVVGAVGLSGDTSDADEATGIAAIEAAGLVADGG